MSTAASSFFREMWASAGTQNSSSPDIDFVGDGALESKYAVTDFASAAIGVAAASIAELVGSVSSRSPAVTVDRRLSSFWFGWSLHPIGWQMPAAWDPIAGDYATNDGWIRLHTNAPHHRKAAEQILGAHSDRSEMARTVSTWSKSDLESAIINAGGCAAEMRSVTEWLEHPQGIAVAAEPLVHVNTTESEAQLSRIPTPTRPLSGLRVLDLTRVLAGPIATRFLAGYGADVLRIDPPTWEEPGVVPEVTLGKRCTRLYLRDPVDRKQFETLLSQADILIHGYRPGALDDLGYGVTKRRALSPGLIDVALDAYGWSGPWASRRGFDSLVQMSAGIAEAGMNWRKGDKPVPLPVQALDHATGYLMAATAIRAVTRRLSEAIGIEAHLSLARMSSLLIQAGGLGCGLPLEPETSDDLVPGIENTEWGEARRLKPPARIVGIEMQWTHPASSLGSALPMWEENPDYARLKM